METSSRPGDPPLSSLGLQQARETGVFLDHLLSSEGISADSITWMSSPFLRTIQTSNAAIDSMKKVIGSNKIEILPEYSIFEWDGKDGAWHKDLPDLQERKHYFPRLNTEYESLYVPPLPEPRGQFHNRCKTAAQTINRVHHFRPGTVLIAVSHAAACIGLTAAASNLTLAEITPAAPCSVYRLTRTNDSPIWTLDPHDMDGGFNGYTDHISDLGKNTVPWNHFGNKAVHKGYTGPPSSRFAPESIKSYIPQSDPEL